MAKIKRCETLRLVLGDQLTPGLSSLRDIDRDTDIVLMAEVMDECTYVPHHPKKIAFVLSAMRHFADELRGQGVRVVYRRMDSSDRSKSFRDTIEVAIAEYKPSRIVVTEPGEWRLLSVFESHREELDVSMEIRADDRFIVSHEWFQNWADGRKLLRMEDFYREVRRKTGLLMYEGEPVGGQWNFDRENRKPIKGHVDVPRRLGVDPDAITESVLDLVQREFDDHFGQLLPFRFAVTRRQAEDLLDRFIQDHLSSFGDYQDAMVFGEPFLFHSVLSMYLNTGLLDPLQVCLRAERAYNEGKAPINAVEGFVRQIVGWREYVRGIYWLHMPNYAETNTFNAKRELPSFYWGADTEMVCVRECVRETRENAYAHHIQRLMVTGNFAMLAGIDPKQVQDWYLAVYADAFEWVELPNTHGMALFADDGIMATKPYAAGGRYIDKMSDYCGLCRYDPKDATAENACPFSFLYWDFLERNRDVLDGNHRLRTVYSALDRMNPERVTRIKENAEAFLNELDAA